MATEVVQIGLCSSGCFPVVSGGFQVVVSGFVWVRLFLSLFDLGLIVFNRSGLCWADMVVIHCTSCTMLKRGVRLFFVVIFSILFM